MKELAIVSVVAIITYGIYRLFELFVRRKERISIIEKLSTGFDPQVFGKQFFLPQFQNGGNVGAWAIRIGLLLVGVGLGVIIASIVDMCTENVRGSYEPIEVFYPACAALFGGLGLVIAYFIERKNCRKDN